MITKKSATFVLFLEGLASSGLQITTIRQTVPFVGNSVLTTSIIISTFLAALAFGYYWGGRQQKSQFQRSLVINLISSVAIFGIGLSYIFVGFFFQEIALLTEGSLFHSPLIHLFAFCVLVMSPLVFLLGQTLPLLLNTSSQESTKSAAAGDATAISTIGSVVGCLMTSLVLMSFFGVGYSILINCIILACCLFFIVNWDTTYAKFAAGFASSFLFVTFFLNIVVAEKMFITTTPYSNYHIASDSILDGKQLIINRSSASFIGNSNKKGWPYIEILKNALFTDDIVNQDILILGAGGFTLTAETTNSANFTYVDVDEAIKPIVEKLFLEEGIKGKFVAADARNYLLNNFSQWDAIIVDLYSNSATIPMHTATFDFFQLVEKRLKPNGKAMLNIAANPRLNDHYSLSMDHTIRQALSRCITDITSYKDTLVNILYFCSPNSDQQTASLYRDDNTQVAVDGYTAFTSTKNWKYY